MNRFSSKTKQELKSYVYVYSDPETKKPFYVGKGTENRAFDHLKDTTESEKVNYINMLRANGKEPIIDILVHGIDDDTAKKVEAAVIDIIGIDNLTNKKSGEGSREYGRISVEKVEAKYNYKELEEKDIKDNVIIFNIAQLYSADLSDIELYDATRGVWDVNLQNAQKAEYAIAEYKGMTIEVYKIVEWFPAYSTMMSRTEDGSKPERYEFVGNIAEENIRKRYINKSVAKFFTNQVRFRYFGPAFR